MSQEYQRGKIKERVLQCRLINPKVHHLVRRLYSVFFFLIGKLGEYIKSACKMVPQNFII